VSPGKFPGSIFYALVYSFNKPGRWRPRRLSAGRVPTQPHWQPGQLDQSGPGPPGGLGGQASQPDSNIDYQCVEEYSEFWTGAYRIGARLRSAWRFIACRSIKGGKIAPTAKLTQLRSITAVINVNTSSVKTPIMICKICLSDRGSLRSFPSTKMASGFSGL
jgi:hypothetical protein